MGVIFRTQQSTLIKLKKHRSVQRIWRTVAQVRFVEWTSEGRLRHAAYLGLRSDKDAKDVTRENLGA